MTLLNKPILWTRHYHIFHHCMSHLPYIWDQCRLLLSMEFMRLSISCSKPNSSWALRLYINASSLKVEPRNAFFQFLECIQQSGLSVHWWPFEPCRWIQHSVYADSSTYYVLWIMIHLNETWDQWRHLLCKELWGHPLDDWTQILPQPYSAILEMKAHSGMI